MTRKLKPSVKNSTQGLVIRCTCYVLAFNVVLATSYYSTFVNIKTNSSITTPVIDYVKIAL